MALSAARPILPRREPRGVQTDRPQAAPPPAQGLEDICLAERIERALRATGYGPLRGIEVIVQGQLVILKGRVSSYYLKQVAQATALSVLEAHEVRNDLEVGRPDGLHQEVRPHATT
jgi:osmotically-inducible protein OsmY